VIKRALIVDAETTGIDESAELIEIGMVLYSLEHRTSLQEFATLVPSTSGNPAEKINRIPSRALEEIGWLKHLYETSSVFSEAMVESADVIIAHNAAFDRRFFPALHQPWLCTMEDFRWPFASRDGLSLVNLALEAGIGVASAHRALTDCRLIAELFNRSENLQELFRVAMRPKARFQAVVSFERREEAKAAGFRWDAAQKVWWRSMAIEDTELLPFRVVQMSETKAA
jgi:DNA polymerase III subunit epsilon